MEKQRIRVNLNGMWYPRYPRIGVTREEMQRWFNALEFCKEYNKIMIKNGVINDIDD